MNFEHYVISFFIYGFLGYIWEVFYCSIVQKRLVNRGFIYMPICPIYGFGAVLTIIILRPLFNYWYLVFIFSILITSIIEYLTSFLLELFFHARWWDYSNKKYNLNGRICLVNSLFFGLIGLLALYFINPQIENIILRIPKVIVYITSGCIIGILGIDFIVSILNNINFNKIMMNVSNILDDNLVGDDRSVFINEILNNDKIIKKMEKIIYRYPSYKIASIGMIDIYNKLKRQGGII